MITKLTRRLCLAFIALFAINISLKAQGDPVMDAQWTVVQNNGTTLKLELGIKTDSVGQNLGPAIFAFLFDPTYVTFASGDSVAVENTDYFWKSGFGPVTAAYDNAQTGVIQNQLHPGEIYINLDYEGGPPGTSIYSTSSYIPVIDLVFAVSDPTKSTSITWAMSEGTPGTFDNVYDDQFVNFDEGVFSGIPVNPLPITLLNFSAKIIGSKTVLNWSTASEINNNYFTVERSADGKDFIPVQQAQGAGTCGTPNYYHCTDEFPLPGTSYYRLKQTDYNGTSQTFNMVSVRNEVADITGLNIISINASETPVMTFYSPAEGNTRLVATDMNGKIQQDMELHAAAGMNAINLNTALWKPGMYIVELFGNGQTSYMKMIKP